MNSINWDKWFEDDCEATPGCPWVDEEPYDDGVVYGDEDDDEEGDED